MTLTETVDPGKTAPVYAGTFTSSLTHMDLYLFETAGPQQSYVFVVSARMAGTQSAGQPNLTTLPNAKTPAVTNVITVHH